MIDVYSDVLKVFQYLNNVTYSYNSQFHLNLGTSVLSFLPAFVFFIRYSWEQILWFGPGAGLVTSWFFSLIIHLHSAFLFCSLQNISCMVSSKRNYSKVHVDMISWRGFCASSWSFVYRFRSYHLEQLASCSNTVGLSKKLKTRSFTRITNRICDCWVALWL